VNPLLRESHHFTPIVEAESVRVVAAGQRRDGCQRAAFPDGTEALPMTAERAKILALQIQRGGIGADRGLAARVRPPALLVQVGQLAPPRAPRSFKVWPPYQRKECCGRPDTRFEDPATYPHC